MADIFNAFSQGMQLGTQQRLMREQQQREAKLNALSGQAFGATDPAQVNQLAQTAAELGGAPAGAQIQAISQGQNELQNQRRNQMFETIARRVASVAQLPEGPEREAAWAAGVNEIVTDPAQRDQLLALGSQQGITAVASQIAPVGDLLAKMGFSVPGGAVSARAQGFEQLAAGLSPEEQLNARRIELGLAPRAAAPGFSVQEVTNPDGTTQFIQVPTRGVAPGQSFAVAAPGAAPMQAPAAQPGGVSINLVGMQPESIAQTIRAIEADLGRPLSSHEIAQAFQSASGAAPRAAAQPARAALQPLATVGGGDSRMGLGQTDAERAAAAAEREAAVVGARTRATAEAERVQAAPADIQQAELTLQNIEALLADPRLEVLTGLSGAIDPRNWPLIERSDIGTGGLAARVEQIQGAAFLEAFDRLKGGGAITEVEGRKAEQAIARLRTAQSDADFRSALTDLRDVLSSSVERNRRALGGNQSVPEDDVSDLLQLYGGN